MVAVRINFPNKQSWQCKSSTPILSETNHITPDLLPFYLLGCGMLIKASIASATDSPSVVAPPDDVDDGVNDCD